MEWTTTEVNDAKNGWGDQICGKWSEDITDWCRTADRQKWMFE